MGSVRIRNCADKTTMNSGPVTEHTAPAIERYFIKQVTALLFAAAILLSAPLSAETTEPLAKDQAIELELDGLLKLRDEQGPEAYTKALLELSMKIAPNAPSGSRIRLDNLLVDHYIETGDSEQAELANRRILAVARRTDHPEAWVLGLAGQWNLLPAAASATERSALIREIQGHLETIRTPRVLYVGYNVVGSAFLRERDFELALSNFQAALQAVSQDDEWRNDYRRLVMRWQIVRVHSELKNWKLVQLLAEEAIDAALAQGHHRFLPDLYLLKGRAHIEQKKPRTAIVAFMEGINWGQKEHTDAADVGLHSGIAEVFISQRKYEQAREELMKAKRSVAPANFDWLEQNFNLSFIDVVLSKRSGSVVKLQETIAELERRGDWILVEKFLDRLSTAYAAIGAHKLEAAALRRQIEVSEIIFEQSRIESVSRLQEQFAAKQQEAEIAGLRTRNALNESELKTANAERRANQLMILAGVLIAALMFALYRKIRRLNMQLVKSNDRLAFDSSHDPLTGLINRRSFHRQFEEEVPGAGDSGVVDGLILLDIDHFKLVNDNYGHLMGDQVLVQVAKRLITVSRANDLVARWGGEEFLLLVRGVNFDVLNKLCGRILCQIGSEPIEFEGKSIYVRASAGFVSLPSCDGAGNPVPFDALVSLIDRALYLSKQRGRNRGFGVAAISAAQGTPEWHDLLDAGGDSLDESASVSLVMVEGPELSGLNQSPRDSDTKHHVVN